MPNIIDANGVTIQTAEEVLDELLNGSTEAAGIYDIYGPNVNVAPNSPDGQLLNVVTRVKLDVLEFVKNAVANFDPDQAVGRMLDQRCAINGVIRQAGTYTLTQVVVTTDRAVTLVGLDTQPVSGAFTVSDSSGTLYSLMTTQYIAGAGANDLQFRAVLLGAITPVPNSLSVIKTPQLGVISTNNPAAATSVGVDEEPDVALRVRRQKSVSLPAQGSLDGLRGALLNIDGVVDSVVLENYTNSTDGNGIPAHSIWAVVLGGSNADVADVIYKKRNAGCDMKGSVSVGIPQPDLSTFTVKFDRPTAESLWIKFDMVPVTGTVSDAYVRTQLLSRLSYGINEKADTTSIVSLVKEIAANASVSVEGVSKDNTTYLTLLSPTSVNRQFTIASTRIIINGVAGT